MIKKLDEGMLDHMKKELLEDSQWTAGKKLSEVYIREILWCSYFELDNDAGEEVEGLAYAEADIAITHVNAVFSQLESENVITRIESQPEYFRIAVQLVNSEGLVIWEKTPEGSAPVAHLKILVNQIPVGACTKITALMGEIWPDKLFYWGQE